MRENFRVSQNTDKSAVPIPYYLNANEKRSPVLLKTNRGKSKKERREVLHV